MLLAIRVRYCCKWIELVFDGNILPDEVQVISGDWEEKPNVYELTRTSNESELFSFDKADNPTEVLNSVQLHRRYIVPLS